MYMNILPTLNSAYTEVERRLKSKMIYILKGTVHEFFTR